MKNNIFIRFLLFLCWWQEVIKRNTKDQGASFLVLISLVFILPAAALFVGMLISLDAFLISAAIVGAWEVFVFGMGKIKHTFVSIGGDPAFWGRQYLFDLIKPPTGGPFILEPNDIVWKSGRKYRIYSKSVLQYQDIRIIDSFSLTYRNLDIPLRIVAEYAKHGQYDPAELLAACESQGNSTYLNLDDYLLLKLRQKREVNMPFIRSAVEAFCSNEIGYNTLIGKLEFIMNIPPPFTNLQIADFSVYTDPITSR